MKKRITLISLVLLCTALLFGQAKPETAQPDSPSILRLSSGMDGGMLTPFKHIRRGPGMFKMQLLYDSLLDAGPDGLIPWLATEYEANDDCTSYQFSLVKDAVWHDGKPLTADDVIFSFNYFQEHPPVTNYLVENGKYIVKSAEKLDDYTIRINLIEFNPTYLERIGRTRIIPRHIWENVEDPRRYEQAGAVIGSGPFVLTDYEPEKKAYRFKAFDKFWGPEPVCDELQYFATGNPVLSFENNEIDLVRISPDMRERFENKEGVTIRQFHSQHCYRIYFNMDKNPVLRNKNLRQAFAYGLDREKLATVITRGYGEVMPMGYLIAEHPMYNPDQKQYSYNPEKAKELLDGKTYHFSLLVSNKPDELKLAELIKIDLEKIGIELEIVSVDYKSRDGMVKAGDYELALLYFGGLGGEANMLKDKFYSYGEGGSVIGYSNPELDKLLDKQAAESNHDKRKAMIWEAQNIISEDVPMLLLFGDIEMCAYRPQKNNYWTSVYNHSKIYHPKLSFVKH